MKFLNIITIMIICSSSHLFASGINPILMFYVVQKIQDLESNGYIQMPVNRKDKIAEIKKMHDKILEKNKFRNKIDKQRKLYGYKDTHLSHHGYRK